jgi:hypothetical protein
MAPRHGARVEMTGALAAPSSLARRRRKISRLGVVLAVVALLAQIAGPGFHARALIGPANGVGKLSVDFGAHALCLGLNGAAPVPAAPTDKTPEADHNFPGCCVWHGATGVVLAPAGLVEPIAFAPIRISYTAPPARIPTRFARAVRARAPPAGA